MNKKWAMIFFGIISLILVASCGSTITHPSSTVGASGTGYVFCIVGYGNAHYGSSASNHNWGVIGYDVAGEPVINTNNTASPWLQVTTTTGKKMIFGSSCYYTQDDPKNLDISWQTR